MANKSNKDDKTIFLSYSWDNTNVADEIDQAFTGTGLKIIRDKKDLKYKNSIKEFMKKINSTDYVILLISKAYLESDNCMFEVLELLKNTDYNKRILPIILKDANIFRPEGKLKVIKYWNDKINRLDSELKSLSNLSNTLGVQQHLDHYTKIRSSIDEFISTLSDLNCISIENLINQKYKPILDLIGYTSENMVSEIIAISTINDMEDREIAINAFSKKYPGNSNILFQKGLLAYKQKKWKTSLAYFTELLEVVPNHYYSYNYIGLVYSNLDSYDEAIAAYNHAITIDPENCTAYCNLGIIYLTCIPDFTIAKKLFEKSLELDKNNAASHGNMAELLHDVRNLFNQPKVSKEIVICHYEESIRLYSSSGNFLDAANIHFKLAQFLRNNTTDLDQAKFHYEQVLKINPKDFKAYCNLAELCRVRGEFELALDYYERALDINPLDVISHNNIANLLFHNIQKYELANYHYKKAQKIDPMYKPENYQLFKAITGYA